MSSESDQVALPVTPQLAHGDQPTDDAGKAVAEQLLIMKKEIDLLQIEVAKPGLPWYRQIPILVSIGALVLSLMTTFYSERRSSQQELHDARVELRQLIIQIDEVSREITDVENRYRNNPQTLQLVRSLATTRRIILVNQAAEVADEIAEDVSAAEYYAVGSALAGLGGTDPRIFDYYKRGLDKEPPPTVAIALHRSLALAYFSIGNVSEGRKSNENAIAAASSMQSTKKLNDARTHMNWATSEVNARECDYAREHFNEARAALSDYARAGGIVSSDYTNQLSLLERLLKHLC